MIIMIMFTLTMMMMMMATMMTTTTHDDDNDETDGYQHLLRLTQVCIKGYTAAGSSEAGFNLSSKSCYVESTKQSVMKPVVAIADPAMRDFQTYLCPPAPRLTRSKIVFDPFWPKERSHGCLSEVACTRHSGFAPMVSALSAVVPPA